MNLTVDYRPQKFSELIGHSNLKTFFKKAFKDKDNFTLPYSTMFVGESGLGKTCSVKIVAKTMNCHEPVLNDEGYYDACGNCQSCKDVEKETYMRDIAFYSGATDNTDSVKSIQEFITYMPTDRTKIVIIDEFQGFNENALKQLLNITEKPIKGIHFLFITMDEKKTNKSINALKGRSQKFFLKQPKDDELLSGVLDLLDTNDVLDNVPDTFYSETLPTIISNSTLGVRGILQDIERCIQSEIYDEKTITQELGYISDKVIHNMIGKLLAKDKTVIADLQETDLKAFYDKSRFQIFKALQYKVFDSKEDVGDWRLKSTRQFASNDTIQELSKVYVDTDNATYYTDNVYMYNICEYLLKVKVERPVRRLVEETTKQANPVQSEEALPRRRVAK